MFNIKHAIISLKKKTKQTFFCCLSPSLLLLPHFSFTAKLKSYCFQWDTFCVSSLCSKLSSSSSSHLAQRPKPSGAHRSCCLSNVAGPFVRPVWPPGCSLQSGAFGLLHWLSSLPEPLPVECSSFFTSAPISPPRWGWVPILPWRWQCLLTPSALSFPHSVLTSYVDLTSFVYCLFPLQCTKSKDFVYFVYWCSP